jgi:hypothetical protein
MFEEELAKSSISKNPEKILENDKWEALKDKL